MEQVVSIDIGAFVGGYDLCVTEARVTLEENGIPSVVLVCAPPLSRRSVPAMEPEVATPTLKWLMDIYRDLYDKARSLDCTGSVYITMKRDGKESEGDQLNIRDWILSGAGMSQATSTTIPNLVVVLQHPICRLTKVGSVYETAKTEQSKSQNSYAENCKDLLEVICATHQWAVDGVEYWPSPKTDGSIDPSEYRKALVHPDFVPTKYLKFKRHGKEATGIFLSGDNDGARKRISQALSRTVFPSDGGSSTWDMLVRASGLALLSIVQDQEDNFTGDHLVLEPKRPWKKADIRLTEDTCFSTGLPSLDPLKLVGVMCRKLGPYGSVPNLAYLEDGNVAKNKDPVEEVFYSPIKKGPRASCGRIQKVSAPAVLDSAFRRDAPHGDNVVQADIDMEPMREDAYDNVLGRYCRSVFELATASAVTGSANMALGFRDGDGHLILPGCACRLEDKNGESIYYGYINRVVHVVSMSGASSTTVSMSYMRPNPGFWVKWDGGGEEIIKYDSPNWAYTTWEA